MNFAVTLCVPGTLQSKFPTMVHGTSSNVAVAVEATIWTEKESHNIGDDFSFTPVPSESDSESRPVGSATGPDVKRLVYKRRSGRQNVRAALDALCEPGRSPPILPGSLLAIACGPSEALEILRKASA